MRVSLREAVGGGYDDFFRCKRRYRVVKGSRGSKKSYTTALYYVYAMMAFWKKHRLKPNLLVVRRYFNSNWDSTRATLIWAIRRLGVEREWRVPVGAYDLTYLPTGQKIIFRGLDDPQSVTSITVSDGHLCWVWFEEAYQIASEDDFDKIDLSVRGDVPAPLFKQVTLLLNPWSDRHWIKGRFFDAPDADTFAMTTTYRCNEFLDADDLAVFERMRAQNPRRYRIEGEGEWGISEGVIFENWKCEEFDIDRLLEEHARERDARGVPSFVHICGMDFGYNDPTAFVAAWADKKRYKIYVYFEFYERMMENRKIAGKLLAAGFGSARINADSEDPRTINELRILGLNGIRPCKKGAGSVLGGIQRLQDYEIVVHPKCPNMKVTLENYCWKKGRDGKTMSEPDHEFSHLADSLRYATEDLPRFGMRV